MVDSDSDQTRTGLIGIRRAAEPILSLSDQIRFVALVLPLCLTPLAVYFLAVKAAGGSASDEVMLGGGVASLLLLLTTYSLFRARARVEHERLDLDHLVRTDPLTGLGNRRAMWESLDVEARRAARLGQPIALLLIDLDRFKEVNDRHGHLVGDRLLRAFANSMRSTTRVDQDPLFRYGGDEFVVVLPATSEAGARAVGVRLSKRYAAEGAKLIEADIVGCSLGVAERLPDESSEAWLDRADKEMYAQRHARADEARLAAL